ncbi:hypothetical protein C8Q77DRAFT_916445 [Trametes polyzona]|nr:hypothetical protein C8Q77DRAFT_916445 [Trametes polyzona]
MQVDQRSLSARNICKRDYAAKHPEATEGEFATYFTSLDDETLRGYKARSLAEKQKAKNEKTKAKRAGRRLSMPASGSSPTQGS